MTERKDGLQWREFAPNNGVVRYEATIPTPDVLSLECLTIYYSPRHDVPYEAMYVEGLGEFDTFEAAESACIRAALDDCAQTIALYEATVNSLRALQPRLASPTESKD